MPKLNAHTAISRQRTGFEFEELHRWIDNGFESEKLGSDHRIKKHAYNKKDMETIRDYWNSLKGPGWGEKAVIEWLFHIGLDNIHAAFKFSKDLYGDRTYNYLKFGIMPTGFVKTEFDRKSSHELNISFSNNSFFKKY